MTTFRNKLTAQNLLNSTAANFREWIQFISNGLEAGGVIKTADTGQIDTATVNAPGAGNTMMGYEIRRFSDALQATKPVFIRLEYGSGSFSGNNFPGVKLTIGTGSDGAGAITGIIFAANHFDLRNTATGDAKRVISVDPDRFLFDMNWNGATGAPQILLERTRDFNYTSNGDGLLLVYREYSGSLTAKARVLDFAKVLASQPPLEAGNLLIPVSGDTLDGANVGTYPPVWFNAGKVPGRSTNIFGYRTNEITTDSVVSLDLDGTAQDYLATAFGTEKFIVNRNANAILLRY